jgi:hypothetical protein
MRKSVAPKFSWLLGFIVLALLVLPAAVWAASVDITNLAPLYVRLNHNDNNLNGVIDMNENPVALECDLVQITVMSTGFDPNTIFYLKATGSALTGETIRVWKDPLKTEELGDIYNGNNFKGAAFKMLDVPPGDDPHWNWFWVEGTKLSGPPPYDGTGLMLWTGVQGEPQDTIRVVTFEANIYTLGLNDITEETIGKLIAVNSDDDNGNGIQDRYETGPVAGENDLVQITITKIAKDGTVTAQGNINLIYAANKLRIWTSSQKGTLVPSGTSYVNSQLPKTLWVEAVLPSDAPLDTAVWWQVACGSNVDDDEIRFNAYMP